MGTLSIILLVLLGIVSVFLIVIVALQDEDDSGLGGVFGGSNSGSVFGSATSSVIIKFTSVLLAIFLVLAIVVAFLSKSKTDSLSTYEVPVVEKTNDESTGAEQNVETTTAPEAKAEESTSVVSGN